MSVDPPSLPPLPDDILEQVEAALEAAEAGAPTGAAAALSARREALCKQHPTHADAIRQWFAAVEESEVGPGPAHLAPGLPRDPLELDLLSSVPVYGGFKVLQPAVLWRTVGAGGMGCVLRGRHLRLDHDVAVKCMQPGIAAANPSVFARFQREAQLGARLSSENIIHVTDCGQAGALRYLVMEWVDGEDLSGRVARLGPRPQSEAVTLLVGITRGLRDVHGAGVLHRDIKPQNVMLGRNGLVKLADLGIASMVTEELTLSGELLGTRAYMAPEQWDGSSPIGPPADLYALGLTAHFILTGGVAKLAPLQDVPPISARMDNVHPRLAAWIDRCCQRDPAARFADGAAALASLLELTDPQGDGSSLGHRDGRLTPEEVALPPAIGDDVAPPMDLAAIAAAAAAGPEAEAATVVSTPAATTQVAAAEAHTKSQAPTSRRRGWPLPVAALAVVAMGLGWWFGFREGDDPGDPAAKPLGNQGVAEGGALKPGEASAADLGPSAAQSDPSTRGTGSGSDPAGDDPPPAGSQPGQDVPANGPPQLVSIIGDFGPLPALEDDTTPWRVAEPLRYQAPRSLALTITAPGARAVRGELQPAGDPSSQPSVVGLVETSDKRQGVFELRWPAVEAGSYELRVVLQGNPEFVLERVLDVPCTLPAVPGLERVPDDGAREYPGEHYAIPSAIDPELADLRFVRMPGLGDIVEGAATRTPSATVGLVADPERRNVLFGITEVSTGHFDAWLRAGKDVFARYTGDAEAYFALIGGRDALDARYQLHLDSIEARREGEMNLPIDYVYIQEAMGFARWLSDRCDVDVRVTDAGVWRRAALRNLGLDLAAAATDAFSRNDVALGNVNFLPAPQDMDIAINQLPGAGAAMWNIWQGPQGETPLFNMAGNADELCPVLDSDSAAIVGWHGAGGGPTVDLSALTLPNPADQPQDPTSAKNGSIGFRLVIYPND